MLAGFGGRLPWIFALVIVLFAGTFVHRGGTNSPGVAAAQEAPATTTEAPAKQMNMLEYTFKALGIRYTIAFLALSFAFVALFIMNLLALRRDSFAPAALVDTFEQCLNEKKWQEAYDYAKGDTSFLGQMLAAGLEKLQVGYPQAIEAMQEVGEEENMKAEHRLSYLALIGTIAPMVGLLGTVDGMIASFQKIAQSDITPKPKELAEGIATALVTTLAGLLIAIPAIGAFNIMKNRMAALVLESGILAERLMGRFESGKR